MFNKKEKLTKEVDTKNLNDVIGLSKKILKIMYGLFIILAIYVALKLFKELNIKSTLLVILKILTPLFISF